VQTIERGWDFDAFEGNRKVLLINRGLAKE
jgi:hypothetical protein